MKKIKFLGPGRSYTIGPLHFIREDLENSVPPFAKERNWHQVEDGPTAELLLKQRHNDRLMFREVLPEEDGEEQRRKEKELEEQRERLRRADEELRKNRVGVFTNKDDAVEWALRAHGVRLSRALSTKELNEQTTRLHQNAQAGFRGQKLVEGLRDAKIDGEEPPKGTGEMTVTPSPLLEKQDQKSRRPVIKKKAGRQPQPDEDFDSAANREEVEEDEEEGVEA
jgi:hypothetical protein